MNDWLDLLLFGRTYDLEDYPHIVKCEPSREPAIGVFEVSKDKWQQTHTLKTIQPYFDEVFHGRKTFELRFNDRNFQIGDRLVLMEWVPNKLTCKQKLSNWIAKNADRYLTPYYPEGYFTGKQISCRISYILSSKVLPGLKQGYVVLALSDFHNPISELY